MKYRTYIYICTTLLEIPAWLEPTVLKPGKHYEGTTCSRKIFDEIIVDRAQTAVTTKTVYFPPLKCMNRISVYFFFRSVRYTGLEDSWANNKYFDEPEGS